MFKFLKFLLAVVISVCVIMLTLQFFRKNDTLALILKTISTTQTAVNQAAQTASQITADAVANAASRIQSGTGVTIAAQPQSSAADGNAAQTASGLPVDNNVWGSTGMQGLKVYEYGKTLLSGEQRGIYSLIARSVEALQSTVTVNTSLSPAQIEKIYQYYFYDHSEIFYLNDTNMRYSYTGSGESIHYQSYTFAFSYRYDAATVQSMRNRLRAAALQMIRYAGGKDELAKERALHDMIVQNTSYDSKAVQNADGYPQSFTAYGALVNKQAVCDGYARAAKILFSSVGIKTLYLTGSAKGGSGWESHGWNMAQIGSKWYYVDTTFDDPLYIDPSGNTVDMTKTVSHQYFNFVSKDDHRLGVFDAGNPFSNESGNYAVMPAAG